MDDRHLTEQQLDAAIDQVAREMTDGDLPAGFRTRITDRIAEPAPSTRIVLRFALAGGALVLCLAAGLGIWQAVRPLQPREAVGVAGRQEVSAPGPAGIGSGPERTAVVTAAASPASNAGAGAVSAHSAAAPLGGLNAPVDSAPPAPTSVGWFDPADRDAGPSPLAGPAPIDLRSILPDPIAIAALSVEPIREIPPIVIPQPGAGSTEPPRRDDQ
jgi:hypothetical protein